MTHLTRQTACRKIPAILVLSSTAAFAVSPFVAASFGDFSADQFLVPQIGPPVQPIGYTFDIWSVIYLWLIAEAIFGALRAGDDPNWRAMRWPLITSLIIGCFWFAAANHAPILATVMILMMAATAIPSMLHAGAMQPWMQVRPVALYAGWLPQHQVLGWASCLAAMQFSRRKQLQSYALSERSSSCSREARVSGVIPLQ
jgi:hypothetical protein